MNEKAQAALARILVGGHSTTPPPGKLAIVSTWPDELRGLKGLGLPFGWDKDDVEEGKAFNTAHASNARWHFVNRPLAAPGYPKPADAGTVLGRLASPDDIVNAINRAITVLEAPAAPANFSKAQAVRCIVHLAGDIHQPFHVPAGYYATTPAALKQPRIIREPSDAVKPGVLGDRGGRA